ncbi:RNA polymerase sigma factor [Armatimonas sp.]|uniref:RNA polymerase sigma factor n=1 Tax=Armatimonas sp. TaxID=1872638 RepID=UPI00286D4599|nr:RNA polymerase sigma factor [Armatimonas sp.]
MQDKELHRAATRFARRLLGSDELVKDIVSEALWALQRNLGRLTEPGSQKAFLFRVVRNLAYSELRRRGRLPEVPLESVEWQQADPTPGPEEALQGALVLAEIQTALEKLAEPQRTALLLYVEEGLSYSQIAEVLATDLGTVKSRIHHARKNLARRLRPETRQSLGLEE